jgi:predicted Zn-dependent protease
MNGGTTSIADMIASTKRGLLVTRFSNISMLDYDSALVSGFTRDGVWLIENGRITRAVRNLRFTESPLFAFNNVDALGASVRVFHPGSPVVVPAAKLRDFNFTGLTSAV